MRRSVFPFPAVIPQCPMALKHPPCLFLPTDRQKQLKFDLNKVVLKAIRITGDVLYQHGVFPAVIKAIDDGRLDKEILQSMITTHIALDDVEEKGIKELIANKSNHIKILIKVNN